MEHTAPSTKETTGNVLLVDDDRFLIDMYSLKFTSAGYKVEACLSVESALEILRGGFAADAIIFDIVMPTSDGFSFLHALAKERIVPHAVKIALTNQSNDAEKAKAEQLGVDRYIVKASMIPSEVVNAAREEINKKLKGRGKSAK